MILVFYSKRVETSLYPPSVLKPLEHLGGSDNWREGGWSEALYNDDDNDDHADGSYPTGNVI